MRIYTKGGDLAFSTFNFPDGQPHFRLETYEREFEAVTIETRIASAAELFMVVLVNAVLRSAGYSQVNLDIRYLMGARMDRAISWAEPFTLQSVANILNGCGFTRVRILDVHSTVAISLIRNSVNLLPKGFIRQVADTLGGDFYVVAPDKGATERVTDVFYPPHVQGHKIRETSTGKLIGFDVVTVLGNPHGANFLIIDDICDGGGTFLGIAKALKDRYGKTCKVYLAVTHGIFSKGSLDPVLIEKIYCTNSFRDAQDGTSNIITVPISMEKLIG